MQKQNLKTINLKSEKGSITVFVTAAMLFLLMILVITFMSLQNKNQAQLKEISKVKQEYEQELENIDAIYEETELKYNIGVSFSTNGGNYYIAKGGTVDFNTEITITNKNGLSISKKEYAFGTSQDTAPESWTTFTGNTVEVSKKGNTVGEYYLWVKVQTGEGDERIEVSNVFAVIEEEIELKANTEEINKGPVQVTIDYKNAYTKNKKVGIGATLDEAKQNAVSNENTTIEVTENSYVYVTAEDNYGNVGEAYIQISNIDNQKPVITLSPNGGTFKTEEDTVTIDVKIDVKDDQSGVEEVKYAWSTSNTEKPADEEFTTIDPGETITSPELGEGKHYLWVIATDKVGNVTEEPSFDYNVVPPAAPTVALKENDANGAEYVSGTWTNQDVYHEITLPEEEGNVTKYQYSFDGQNWKEYVGEDPNKVDYTTTFPMDTTNKPSWLGDLTNNGGYYFVTDGNGAIKPTNGDNQDLKSTTANSYIKIDLTSYSKEDVIGVTLNAEVSSESGYDYGYATITETEEAPEYSNSTGRFIYISGSKTAQDYKTSLTGGNVYYLHFGYRKDSSGDSNNDTFKINSLQLANNKTYTTNFPINKAETPVWMGDLTNNGDYYFVTDGNGAIKPTNGDKQELHSTTANSYIKLDLSSYSESDILNITVNAEVSSESADYGYATITEDTIAPSYSSSTGRIFRISGSKTAQDYNTSLIGGKVYYLHFGYRKDSSVDRYNDTFKINSITFDSATMIKFVEFYDYSLQGNKATYAIKQDVNKDFYVKGFYDNGKTSRVSQFKVQIDKIAPVVNKYELVMDSITDAKLVISDITENASGLRGYYISTSEEAPTKESNWIESTENSLEIDNLTAGNTYYIWLIDNAGNISEVIKQEVTGANYKIDSNKYAVTLEQALALAKENSTIELLNDYTDTSTATIDKSITLNTGNYTLIRTVTTNVKGTTDSPVTLEFYGKITNSGNIVTLTTSGTVNLNGTGTIENVTTSTSSSYRAISNSGTLTQDGNITVSGYYYGIYNTGTYTLNSGKVISNYNSSSSCAIYNSSSRDIVNINGGEVVGYSGIYNDNSSTTNINGGKVEGKNSSGISQSQGSVTVNDGEIIGKSSGIYINNSGTTNVIGGKVEGNYGIQTSSSSAVVNVIGGIVVGSTYGIYGSTTGTEGNEKITIGDINTEVNEKQPVVSGGQYGVYMRNSTYSYNFYNGVIMGTNSKPYTDIVKPREGYMVYTYYNYNAKRYCAVLSQSVENITITQYPTEWTNQDVEVTIKYPTVEGATNQYSENGTDWVDIENGTKVNVSENKTIYARMLDSQGILIDPGVVEHKVENIDKIAPEVNVTTDKTKYTILEENEKVDISYSITASDEGGSNLKEAKYAFVLGNEEPQEYQNITNDLQITENLGKGTYYLWLKVSDNAGNISDITKIRFMVDLKEPVAQIGDTVYETIQDAFDAAGQTNSTVIILKDTDETATLAEGQTVTLDLQGHTVGNSKEEAVITNNGTLTITDTSNEKTGTIDNLVGTGIENNGTLTIGDNSNAIEDAVPTIKGNKVGIQNNNTLNYYDGTIIGKSAISGEVQSTPENYGPVGVYENRMTTVNLRVVSDYVARIDWFYYTTLQSAFEACPAKENNTEQTTVHMLKDIVLDSSVNVYYGQNIRLNLNSYTLTNTTDIVINNYEKLEITDLTEEKNGNISSSKDGKSSKYYKLINNEKDLTINGAKIISQKSYNYIIYNNAKANLKINEGEISGNNATSVLGIYNDIGTVNIAGGNIDINLSTQKSYGIQNNKGIIEISGGSVSAYNKSSESYGIYNDDGFVKLINGKVSSESPDAIFKDVAAIYNINAGKVEIQGGEIVSTTTSSGDNSTYGIYNADEGNVVINGGKINSSSVGISNKSTGKIIIEKATISVTENNIRNTGCGIKNMGNGIVEFNSGTIRVNVSAGANGYGYGVQNYGEGTIDINGGSIEVEGIHTGSSSNLTYAYGVYNQANGLIKIKNGNITSLKGYGPTIYNRSSGKIEIINGNITNDTEYSNEYIIENYGTGIINIGTKGDGVVNIDKPQLKGKNGIENNEGVVNFYDGVIYATKKIIIGTLNELEKGYVTKEDVIDNFNCLYLIEENNYKKVAKIETTGMEYSTLQEAILNTEDNKKETITILEDFTINSGAIIFEENKDIMLNLNGKTITNNKFRIENKGNLEILGEGEIDFIDTNIGIINSNNGNLKISGGNINTVGTDKYTIYNTSTGVVEFNQGNLNGEIGNINTGKVILNGGNIVSKKTYGIYNKNDGNIEIIDGKIEGQTSGISVGKGAVIISGGNINATSYGISNTGASSPSGIVTVKGGIIQGNEYGIYNPYSGNIEIIDGEVSGGEYGIYNANGTKSDGTIILGTKGDGILNTDNPLIKGKYGIKSYENLYFYDGRIEGTTLALSEDSRITEIEENTTQKYENDEKILTLSTEEVDLAQVGDKTYSNLQEAIDVAGTTRTTIKLLRGIRYTNADTSLIIASNQNIILDLNGNTIISAFAEPTFVNNGQLEITDTSEERKGKITTNQVDTTIQNNNGANLIISEGNIVNEKVSQGSINNEGTLTIKGGNVLGVTNIGTTNINGGITSGVLNKEAAILNIIDGLIDDAVMNQDQAKIEMNGGIIGGANTAVGINNSSSNIINITGGTIELSRLGSTAIITTSGTANIGNKDRNINVQEPTILASKGIQVSKSAILNFYDGTIKNRFDGISGNINEIEENSKLVFGKEIIDDINYETLTLQNADSIAQVGTVKYDSIKKAISSISDTGTVTILRDGIEASTVDIPSEKNITIDLNGYELKMYNKIQNNGNLTITDSSEGATGVLSTYKDSPIYNNGNLTIEKGNISGNTYGIYNQGGTTNIVEGNITDNTYGLYVRSGTINVTGGNINNNQYGTFAYSGTIINISQGNFTGNEYAVYNSSGTTNITGITLSGNTNNIYNGGNGTINILSGNIVTTDSAAIENASTGTIVIGEEGGTPSKESPLIQAEEYAIKNTGNGTIKFYDGIIKGRTGALQGLYLYTETGYTVKTDYIDGYYCDTLTPSGTVTTVAKIGNVEYSNLQSAINACTSSEPTTIQLVNSISTENTFQIEEGQNVIIDLNGKTITTSTAQTVINNAGTLAIIDTSSLQVGKIANETYNAIENSGTLTLGQDDGTVSTTCPEILGKAKAIINTGTLNFYDGIIKGATALEGTVTTRPSGYIMIKTTEETTGYEMLTLSL